MIENSLCVYVTADAALQVLLGGDANDKKIYPLEAPQSSTLPFLVYKVTDIGGLEQLLSEIRITISITAETPLALKNICDALIVLLDKQDEIMGFWTDADYFIYWSKLNGGGDIAPQFESRKEFVRVLNFDIKYKKKV